MELCSKMEGWGGLATAGLPFMGKTSAFQGAELSLLLSSDDDATLGGTEGGAKSVERMGEKDDDSIDANRLKKPQSGRGVSSEHVHR